MDEKIQNVIECLRTEPMSKRAVIPIPFASEGSKNADWKDQGQNKCCRELHFYLEKYDEEVKLCCTGIVRMQVSWLSTRSEALKLNITDKLSLCLRLSYGPECQYFRQGKAPRKYTPTAIRLNILRDSLLTCLN